MIKILLCSSLGLLLFAEAGIATLMLKTINITGFFLDSLF
jgi:hypothetical protein